MIKVLGLSIFLGSMLFSWGFGAMLAADYIMDFVGRERGFMALMFVLACIGAFPIARSFYEDGGRWN